MVALSITTNVLAEPGGSAMLGAIKPWTVGAAMSLGVAQRVSLKAGEATTLSFTLGPAAFRMWNVAMQRVVEPGAFDIMAGPNSVDLKTTVLHIGG